MKYELALLAAVLLSPTRSAAQFIVPTRPVSLPAVSVPLNLPASFPAPSLPLIQVPVLTAARPVPSLTASALPVVEAHLAETVPAHAAAALPATGPIELPAPSALWHRESLHLPGRAGTPVHLVLAEPAPRRAFASLRRIGAQAAAGEFDGLPYANAVAVP